MSLNFITAWRTINDKIKRVLIWRFFLVLIKISYGQIGDQTGFFYTTNPVFYTSGNRFVRRTGTFGNLIFSLVSSRTLTKLKSQSQKLFNERKYQYLKYKNKNHSGTDT
jgi:hypothetical protein